MSLAYGLTPTGFAIKTLAQIQSELTSAFQAAFGSSVDLSGGSVLGQLMNIFAGREADLWELAQAVHLSAFPDSAQGADLSYAVTTTGQSRLAATYSEVTLTLTGTANTVIPSGSQVSSTATGAVFATQSAVTLDGTGKATNVLAVATQTGPLTAPANTVTNIVTTVTGWSAVNNPTDAVVGRNIETDAALRARRATDLVSATAGTYLAVKNALLAVTGVTFADVTENAGDLTDASNQPPHSIHCFVLAPTDTKTQAAIAQAIWASKPAGATTYGGATPSTYTITDSYGNAQVINWDTASNLNIYLSATVTWVSGVTPNNSAVINALLAYGATLTRGQAVYNWQLIAALASVSGIAAVTINQGTSANPTGTAAIVSTGSQLPTLLAANIAVQ